MLPGDGSRATPPAGDGSSETPPTRATFEEGACGVPADADMMSAVFEVVTRKRKERNE